MKRFSTYLLLAVFLMYQAGFYLFYLTLKHHNEEAWEGIVNLKSLKGRIIEKSIPITFPYQADESDFQSVMKSIEVYGHYYRVIMQRYAKDTLHVYYMVDNDRQNLHMSLKDWVNTITQPATQDKNSVIKDGLEKNYMPNDIKIVLINSYSDNSVYHYSYIAKLLFNPIDTLKPPPKFKAGEVIA